ncbi:MAG: hypothetical protein CFE34_09390 [Rhodobacteraceae bacterium PARR1]|nr:MAG: hypothetical protein CFE34_09390 [Rhodobacteraceae bacterium PARR1]
MLWINKARMDDTSAAVVAEGLYALTPVATPQGWVRAGSLVAGAEVMTFDGGPTRIASVSTHRLDPRAPRAAWPLQVPMEVLGNTEPAVLLPEQGVMLDSDLAEDMYGEPFVTVPAAALEGWRGIIRVPPLAQTVVKLAFDTPALIYAGGDMIVVCPGLPMLSLAHGDLGTSVPPLGPAAARHLVGCMMAAEAQERARHDMAG